MTAEQGSTFRSVTLPFIVFTAIWGSTWIVIRGQLGSVAPQWSVTYRFAVAAIAMSLVALAKGESLRIGWRGVAAATFLGEAPVPYPSYSDPDKDIYDTIGGLGFPNTAYYDRSGELLYVKQGGYGSEADLLADIRQYALKSG